MGRRDLFDRYNFDESWDSKANLQLLDAIPKEFQQSADSEAGMADVVAIVDTSSMFPPDRIVSESSVRDPQSQTILVVQAPAANIPWTQPKDISFNEFVDQVHNSADGSVKTRMHFVTNHGLACREFLGTESVGLLQALMTIAGNDDAQPFFAY